jgi:signal transduction histidine kinase
MVAEGLAAALEELAEEVTDVHGVDCICSVEGPGLVHDNEVGTHLYYIAREAVHNAVRHGMPTNVRIDLCTNGRDGSLAVRDNGNGFSATEFDRTGIGLRIMQYRAEMIGGHLTITPLPDGGTVLRCTFRDALAATRA